MGLKAFLTELRRRGVLKAAAAYAAIGWVALEGLSLLFQNFGAPGWVIKVVTTLAILGFPVWVDDPILPWVRASSAATVALLNSPDHPTALIVQARSSMLVDRDAKAAAGLFERARAGGAEPPLWAFNKTYFLDGPVTRCTH